MSKKLTRKEKIALQQEELKNNPAPAKKNPKQSKAQDKLRLSLGMLVAALAFFLYANTLGHQYARDDYSIIKENVVTKKGTAALKEIMSTTYRTGYTSSDYQLYRPLSKAIFAIEWSMAEDSPALGHWIHVLFYALTGFLLFYALSLYLDGQWLVSFLTASLFMAHPIHTEVAANIKSLDEVLGFLFFVIAAIFVHRYVTRNTAVNLVFAAISFFLSLLSKESSITFLAVIPLMVWFFTNASIAKNGTAAVALALVAALFMVIRADVISKATNGHILGAEVSVADNLLSGQDAAHRFATAVYIMGIYLKQLIFPHPLVSDRSYNDIPIVGFGSWEFLLSFAAYAALGIYAIVRFRKKDPVSFAILYFFITASVASNILMLIGTSYGERLMYAPSLGFCLAIAVLLARLSQNATVISVINTIPDFFKKYSKSFSALAIILVLYSFKTITRNADWHDNVALALSDVKDAPHSTRAHFYLGNALSQDEFLNTLDSASRNKFLDSANHELLASIKIYPAFADAWQQVGKNYLAKKDLKNAAYYYKKALEINPQNPLFLNNYGNVLFSQNKWDSALVVFQDAIRWNPQYADAYINVASVYGAMGENLNAYGKQAENKGNKEEAQRFYSESGKKFQLAIDYFQKTVAVDPNYAKAYYFLGVTYRNIGDNGNAQANFSKAHELDPKHF